MKLVLSALVLGSASMLSAAPQPAQRAPATVVEPAPPSIERQMLARRYISLAISPDQFLKAIRAGMIAGFSSEVDSELDESEKADAYAYMNRFATLFEPKVRERMPNIMEAYAQVYAREFSAEELQAMIAFAQSPTGRHYLARSLELATDPAIQIQQQGISNDAFPIFLQIIKEQCAARTAKRIAMGDKKAKCPLANIPDTQAG